MVLPLLVLLLSVIAWGLALLPAPAADQSTDPSPPPRPLPWIPLLVAFGLLLAGSAIGLGGLPAGRWVTLGIAAGGLVTLLVLLAAQRPTASGGLIACGAAGFLVSGLALLPHAAWAPAIASAIIASGLLTGLAPEPGRRIAAEATLLIASAGGLLLLAAQRPEPRMAQLATLALALLLLVALIARGITLIGSAGRQIVLPVSFLLAAAGGYAIAGYVALPQPLLLAAIAAASTLILVLLVPGQERPAPGPALLGCLIAITVGTIAFGLAQGTGLALVALVACGVLVLCQRPDALLAASPLVILAWHRVLQEYGGTLQATLNPNQHYVLIGLLLGAGLPALLALQSEAAEDDPQGPWYWLPVAGLGLLIASATPLLLADRAATGFLAGAALAPFVALTGHPVARPVLGMAPLTVATAFLTVMLRPEAFLLTRDEKISWLLLLGGAGFLLALPLAFRKPTPAPAVEEVAP